jgi:MFS family permease
MNDAGALTGPLIAAALLGISLMIQFVFVLAVIPTIIVIVAIVPLPRVWLLESAVRTTPRPPQPLRTLCVSSTRILFVKTRRTESLSFGAPPDYGPPPMNRLFVHAQHHHHHPSRVGR